MLKNSIYYRVTIACLVSLVFIIAAFAFGNTVIQFASNSDEIFTKSSDEIEKTVEERNLENVMEAAFSQLGTPDELTVMYQDWARAMGGSVPEAGPCAAFISWCFSQAEIPYNFMDGYVTGYPHEIYDYYNALGRVDMTPKVGDISFVNDAEWAAGLSASHCAYIIDVTDDKKTYTVIEVITGGVQTKVHSVDEPEFRGVAHIDYSENPITPQIQEEGFMVDFGDGPLAFSGDGTEEIIDPGFVDPNVGMPDVSAPEIVPDVSTPEIANPDFIGSDFVEPENAESDIIDNNVVYG